MEVSDIITILEIRDHHNDDYSGLYSKPAPTLNSTAARGWAPDQDREEDPHERGRRAAGPSISDLGKGWTKRLPI